MSTNQGGGDFQQGNCQGFRFSNQNEPVQRYVSPQAPQVQMLIMGDSHGDIGTGSFAEFQQFLQWKCRSESMSMNSSLNSSFGQQSTRLSDTSHVPTLMSTPNDSKTKHVKRKHKKSDVSSSSSGSSIQILTLTLPPHQNQMTVTTERGRSIHKKVEGKAVKNHAAKSHTTGGPGHSDGHRHRKADLKGHNQNHHRLC